MLARLIERDLIQKDPLSDVFIDWQLNQELYRHAHNVPVLPESAGEDQWKAELLASVQKQAQMSARALEQQAILRDTRMALSKMDDALDEQRQKNAAATSRIAFLTDQCHEKDVTLSVLRGELQALQIELIKAEEKAKMLAEENQIVVAKYMERVNADADKMNQATMMFEEVRAAQERANLERRVNQDSAAGPVMSGRRSRTQSNRAVDIEPPTSMRKSFVGHGGEITSLTFNSSGSMFATGSADKTVKLWDARTGAHQSTLRGSLQTVMSVAFSPSGEFVLGGCNDNSARLWSVERGQERHTLTGHVGKVFSASFSVDGSKIATGSHDRTLKLWDLQKGHCMRTIFCFSSANAVALHRDGVMLMSGHFDSSLRFWSLEKGDSIKEVSNAHKGQITSLAMLPNGGHVLTCGRDDKIRLFDVRTFTCVRTFDDPRFRVGLNWTKIAVSGDGRFVTAPGHNGDVFTWNIHAGTLHGVLSGHEGVVSAAGFNPTQSMLATADRTGKICIWD